jgi:predicted CoA-binding protein
MNTQADVDAFLSEKKLAIVGLSRDPMSFSAGALKQLLAGGYQVFPINPNAGEVHGHTCWPDMASLPEKVNAAIFFTPPALTEQVLPQVAAAGVKKVWLQQGTDSPAVLKLCADHQLQTVSKQCIMMFAEPIASFHKFHRGIKRFFGGMPK